MKRNYSYRPAAALFFAALVLQVFVLQGLHHVLEHHHDDDTCSLKGAHIHAEGHGHFSCDICLFHFAPTDLQAEDLIVHLPDIVHTQSSFTYHNFHFAQELRQSYLRGPPMLTV